MDPVWDDFDKSFVNSRIISTSTCQSTSYIEVESATGSKCWLLGDLSQIRVVRSLALTNTILLTQLIIGYLTIACSVDDSTLGMLSVYTLQQMTICYELA